MRHQAEQARQQRRGEKSHGDIAEKRDRGADRDQADRFLIVVADILPIAVEQQRQRDDNGKQPDQLDRFEKEAPDVGRVLVAHLAIVRRCRHGRRPMPVLAVRDALPALQRGRMAELAAVADRRVDVERRTDADEGIAADGQRTHMDVAGLRPKAEDQRFLA